MADEKTPQDENNQTANDVDWKSKYEEMRKHSREWEKKAQDNKSAADELEKMKAEKLTEQEKAEQRAAAAEAELNELKAEQARINAATEKAKETGIPFELLMFCADEEAMDEFAKAYQKETHVPAAPSGTGRPRINRGNEKAVSTAEIFADYAQQFF